MSGWFAAQIVHTGRLPLFCFFVAFLASFSFIRLSVRLIRAQVRWWPGNVTRGDTHLHHMVFGVIFMVISGVAGIAAPVQSLGWRAGTATLFGVGTALVLDEFALILHLRDVYWSSAGRVSIDAVFIAAGITALLLLGVSPAGVQDVADYLHVPGSTDGLTSLVVTLVLVFALAAVTLLKGKIWTGLFGLFLPVLIVVGALRLARPHSPWARWRYQRKPRKLARASRREERLRQPAIRARIRVEDLVAGYHDRPGSQPGSAQDKSDGPLGRSRSGFTAGRRARASNVLGGESRQCRGPGHRIRRPRAVDDPPGAGRGEDLHRRDAQVLVVQPDRERLGVGDGGHQRRAVPDHRVQVILAGQAGVLAEADQLGGLG
jgi:hypothetical protein